MNSILYVLTLSLGISTALVLYNHLGEVALNFRFILIGVALVQWFIKKQDEANSQKQWNWQSLWQKLRSFVNKSESVSSNPINTDPIDAVTPHLTVQSELAQPQSVQESAESRTKISALVKNLSSTDWRKLCNQLGLNGGKISVKDRAEFLLKGDVTVEQLQQKIAYLLNSEPN
ncbi:hypothetical protein H6G23_20000 [Desertifilum sp. FACHB-866]|nr:hypothetical protein [Desertifilum sp. FACHB-866]MBD2333911.1 hypothetical protein [Desertifilum sp. FACHB-868]